MSSAVSDNGAENEKKRIIEDITKSGLPCEIDVSAKLRSTGWIVINQEAYLDEDTRDIRYIDMYACKHVRKLPQIILTIECCKSDKPWVFYGSWKRWSNPTITPHFLPEKLPPEKIFFDIAPCSHQTKKDVFEGTIPYEPFKKGKNIDIFDASMKAVKALRYEWTQLKKFDKKYKQNFIRIFYPTIVFDGHLYCLIVRKGKIIPSKTKYIRYFISYKERNFLIDVVTRDGFDNYLALFNEEYNALRQILSAQ